MMWRMIRTLLILPGTAIVLLPGLILWAAAGTPVAGALSDPGAVTGEAPFWIGLGAFGAGLFLAGWTMKLFMAVGQGTPAPWDPPQNLVIQGPYRHVRNPMISSVLFMLLGEALMAQSWPLAAWWLFFFAANAVYFPVVEEKGLERRFGGDYLTYKANVPRWLPRPKPWQPPEDSEDPED